jgi:hypothetical protein
MMMLTRQVLSITSKKGQLRLRQCKHWGAFFRLAPHFQPQMDAFHCAIANAVICLNSFRSPVEPFRQPSLLGPETHFIKTRKALVGKKDPGLTLEQLAQLTKHFGLVTRTVHATALDMGLPLFRKQIKESVRSGTKVIVANFTFEVVLGAGGGHFSPVGAYHPQSDSALVLDVANHRTLWYWAPVELLYKAMTPIDSSSSKPRGYLIISAN